MNEYIDQSKCDKFQIFCLNLMSFLKEPDLWEEAKETGYINWDEMDRYSRFEIDFHKEIDWMTKLLDDDKCLELADNFAAAAIRFKNYIESKY